MRIEDFKNQMSNEPVILHTDNGRNGSKNRRMTISATVADGHLFIAKSVCSKNDQFRKHEGVSKSLGRLLSILTYWKADSNKLIKSVHRLLHVIEICEYPRKFDRKEVLQVIAAIK